MWRINKAYILEVIWLEKEMLGKSRSLLNPNIQAGSLVASQVWGQLRVHTELEAILGYSEILSQPPKPKSCWRILTFLAYLNSWHKGYE